MRKAKVDVSRFRFDSDPKLLEFNKNVSALAADQSRLSARLVDATNRERQAQEKLNGINIKILLGGANEEDARRARQERDDVEQETIALRAALAEIGERAGAAQTAQSELEATLKADCRRRAMVAYRAKAKELAPLLMTARDICRDMGALYEFVNVVGIPGTMPSLRATDHDLATGNGELGRWFADLESFDWASYGA